MENFISRLTENKPLLVKLLIASFLVNLLALATPIYVIQVLQRFVAYGVVSTLVTLVIGISFIIIFEFFFRNIRHRMAREYELKNINGTNNIFVSKESDIYGNMLLYKKLIENAEEIHCINSSFIHLVERVNNIGKIYYHHIRKSKLFLKKRWKVINYED